VKLRLPTNPMIKRTMHLPGSNHSNLQVQAAVTAVTAIIKEYVCFIVVYCFFTVGSAKFLQLSFAIFLGEELAEFGFAREECEKNFGNHWFSPIAWLLYYRESRSEDKSYENVLSV